MRPFACAALFSVAAFGQSTETAARFDIADVHVSAKTANPYVQNRPVRGGRYEVKTATMVDLIRIAYGFDADKILGGPSWLEMDRLDVIAKVPADSTPETQKLMLQSLLEERFKLAIHKNTRPQPAYALTVGKKPQLKEADGSGDTTGCRLSTASTPPAEGGNRMITMNANGVATTINLGPGMTVQYLCRNMTMAAFAEGLRGMMGTSSIGPNPVLDETGLKGSWNFDVKWSLTMNGPMMANAGERITVFDAVEKQLGLKLEPRQVPMTVLVVDSVNEKPSDNPPGVAEALPSIPAPTEFEVADVKPSDLDLRTPARFQLQPGGRLVVQGMPMTFLIGQAFNTFNSEAVAGLPKRANTDRFNITAQVASGAALDYDTLAQPMLALLADRFKMAYHNEERPVTAYSLVAAKPKMKKADPASRTSCKSPNAPAGAPPGTQVLICQNITMAQFADRLQGVAPGLLNWPVPDATGIEGGWDFTLTFTRTFPTMGGPGRGGDAGQAGNDASAASDPSGAITLFEAVEKQLGLKLEKQKRSMPVIVIDHIEEKPTDN